MHHYVYKVTDTEGNFYIGSRTSFKPPHVDRYSGSGKWPREQRELGIDLLKEVLFITETREEACEIESQLIEKHFDDPRFQNLSRSAPVPSFEWSNPLRGIVSSGIMDAGPLAVCLWIEVVAAGPEFGISNAVLAFRSNLTVSECDDALARISGLIPSHLPQITKTNHIWKSHY